MHERDRVTPAYAADRSQWVDVAKAVAIIGVVLFHAGSLASVNDQAARVWRVVDIGIFTFILPLFFLLSGLFVGRSLGLPQLAYLRTKVWPVAYLWIAWSSLFVVLFWVTGGRLGATVLATLTLHTILWYLAALAVHLTVARLTRTVPASIQLAAALLLAVPFAILQPFEGWGLAHTPHFYIFFLVGVLLRDQIIEAVRVGRAVHMMIFVAVGMLLLAVAGVLPQTDRVVYALAPLVAVPIILIISRMLTGWSVVAGPAAYLGRRTLSVFVTHPLVIQLVGLAVVDRNVGVAFAGLLPIFALSIALVVGLAADLILGRVPGVFGPPRREGGLAEKGYGRA